MHRLHNRLTPGQYLSAGSKAPVQSFQGTLDSGCALHACASALAILGRIADPAAVSSRKRGPEADFWNRAAPLYFTGATLAEVAEVIRESPQWNLRPVVFEGSHRDVIEFCEREMSCGRLVIVSWRPVGVSFRHAVLVVGVEGRMQGYQFQPHALLILDPGERDAAMATCNARLNYVNAVSGKRTRYGTYITAGDKFSVVLDGAVSLRESYNPTGNAKPP